MNKIRLDHLLVNKQLVPTRSQAESYIRLGQVKVDGKIIKKPGYFVREDSEIQFGAKEQYVSRAALKLASVANILNLDFKNKVVLDVGSSTGGFTDYALQHGAKEVIAIDVGTNQLHPKLREDSRVELHEKTDIRNVFLQKTESRDVSHELRANKVEITQVPDVILIDVSFISMRMILPHISSLISHNSQVVAMLKPQFEASRSQLNKGIVKNSKYRRDILHGFEGWCLENGFVILKKSDSAVAGEKGNVERFYLLKKL
ncbi:TlyA family RNA methyltransferase [Candidatus Nomurabacteria bacterium]|nr:TlyA family RNA methyltransferase [Candidatus Nomurabacteria bacterium]